MKDAESIWALITKLDQVRDGLRKRAYQMDQEKRRKELVEWGDLKELFTYHFKFTCKEYAGEGSAARWHAVPTTDKGKEFVSWAGARRHSHSFFTELRVLSGITQLCMCSPINGTFEFFIDAYQIDMYHLTNELLPRATFEVSEEAAEVFTRQYSKFEDEVREAQKRRRQYADTLFKLRPMDQSENGDV